MGKVLAHDVHVTDDGYNVVVLPAGSKVPKKFADLVTNPKAYVEEIVDLDEPETATAAVVGYDKLKGPQLKALLKERELPQTGTNPEMIARLTAYDAEAAEAAADDEGDDDASSDDGDESDTDTDTEN
jgi:hypothetical protein